MKNENLHKREEERFYFNMNIFDDDHVEEPEEPEEPPPPTFSEEELEGAKAAAYAQGKKEGYEEAANEAKVARSQMIAATLQSIAEQYSTLFAEEKERAALFEREVIDLCEKIFETFMPVYNQQLGTEELKTNLEQILRKQQNQKAIQVQVHPENVAGVDKFLASLIEKGYNTHFTVHGDETLSERGCKMCWDHGGAVVDPKKTAEEFLNVIQQMLAGSATTSHDGDVEAMPIEINNENENTDLEDIVENPDG